MGERPRVDPFPENRREEDAGAVFVLQSKGQWWHAGFHLTTAIVGPTILALPFVFRGLGWGLGFFCLTVMGVVTFYSYYLMTKVLQHCEKAGRRHIRFRELAADVLGSGWMFYFVIFIQTAINTGIGIGAILLAAECLKIVYSNLVPNGSLKLYEFIAMVTLAMIVLSQLPTFHSLRHINLGSLLLSLGYTFLVVAACIYAGTSKNAPSREYSLEPSKLHKVFNAFTSISIIAAIFGNGILPEIQCLDIGCLETKLARIFSRACCRMKDLPWLQHGFLALLSSLFSFSSLPLASFIPKLLMRSWRKIQLT
ncbi:hypothetical protein I3843_11G120700 [Carya illinoinensis]|nr:hypothetical protein I3843_11G120700 [Carya illinoinensis]